MGEPRIVSFQYTATDSHGATSAPGTVTITVTGANDGPIAQAVSAPAAVEDGPPVTAAFDADDVDSDDGPASLDYAISSPATGGSVVNNGDGTFTFTPDVNIQDLALGENRSVTFEYTATDSHGATSAPATVSIDVTGVNDAPVAQLTAAAAAEDGATASAAFQGDDIDSDDDQSTLTYAILAQPSEGAAVNNGNGTFTFDPGADFQDLDDGESRQTSFTYRALDAHGAASDPATVTVTVSGTNDAPVVDLNGPAAGLDFTAPFIVVGGPVAIASPTLGVSDVDDANLVSATITLTNPQGGDALSIFGALPGGIAASIAANQIVLSGSAPQADYQAAIGQIRFDTASAAITDRTVSVVVDDGDAASAVATTTISPFPNDVPVVDLDTDNSTATGASSATTFTEGGGAVAIADDVSIADLDDTTLASVTITLQNHKPGDALSVLGDLPSAITATITDNKIVVLDGSASLADYQTAIAQVQFENTSENPDTSTRSVSVTANDGTGDGPAALSLVAVAAQNDAPTAVADSSDVGADGPAVIIDLTGNDTDPEADTLSIQSLDLTGTLGTVEIQLNGTSVSYDPSGGFEALAIGESTEDSFDYTVTDGNGGQSNATVTVTITGANDAPSVSAVATGAVEDGIGVTASFSGDDIDSDDTPASLSFALLSQPSEGAVVNNGNGTFTFDPGADFQDLASARLGWSRSSTPPPTPTPRPARQAP